MMAEVGQHDLLMMLRAELRRSRALKRASASAMVGRWWCRSPKAESHDKGTNAWHERAMHAGHVSSKGPGTPLPRVRAPHAYGPGRRRVEVPL